MRATDDRRRCVRRRRRDRDCGRCGSGILGDAAMTREDWAVLADKIIVAGAVVLLVLMLTGVLS